MRDYYKLKAILSVLAFLTALVIGFIALFIPPEGIIDSTVLWFTAQMLLFVSGLLGVNLSLDNLGMIGHAKKQVYGIRKKEKDKEEEEVNEEEDVTSEYVE